MLDRYGDYSKIYTDGSKRDDRVGIGVYCSQDKSEQKHRITDKTTIATAELAAIELALQHAREEHIRDNRPIAIIADSMSALLAISNEDPKTRQDLIGSIKK